MKNSYQRLASLWEKLGLSLDTASPNKAEVKAYCAGIELVEKYFEYIFSQIFFESSENIALSYYCEMLGIDGSLPEQEKKRLIALRLKERPGDYEAGELERAVKAIDSTIDVTVGDFIGYTSFYGSCKGKHHILPRLADLIENYIPVCTDVSFGGGGFDFNYWDSTPYLFNDFDNFCLSFYFIETLN